MADLKEFTYSDVSEHATKKDLYIVVHDKVYNASSFVDEHPYVGPSFAPFFTPEPTSIAHRCNVASGPISDRCKLHALDFVANSKQQRR